MAKDPELRLCSPLSREDSEVRLAPGYKAWECIHQARPQRAQSQMTYQVEGLSVSR